MTGVGVGVTVGVGVGVDAGAPPPPDEPPLPPVLEEHTTLLVFGEIVTVFVLAGTMARTLLAPVHVTPKPISLERLYPAAEVRVSDWPEEIVTVIVVVPLVVTESASELAAII